MTALVEPVVRAIEHAAYARWAATDATVLRPLDAAREALVLGLSSEEARPWACLLAYRHLTVAQRMLPDDAGKATKQARTVEVARTRIGAALTALAECANANVQALTEREPPEPGWALGAAGPTPKRSEARRSDSARRKRGASR